MTKRKDEPITAITARGKLRYRVIVDTGIVNGKRTQVRKTFDTKGAARKFLARTRTEVDEGRYQHKSALTFNQVADRWLAEKEMKVRAGTAYKYKSGLTGARDRFGDKRIQHVTRDDVAGVVADLVAKGRTKRTAEYTIGLLRQVFTYAMQEDLILRNPAQFVTPAGAQSAPNEAFTIEEMRAIRDAIRGGRLEAGFLLSLNGLRRSEVLALTWADVDLKASEIDIHQSRTEVGGHDTEVNEPKTRRGYRTLPIDEDTVAVLRALRTQQQTLYGFDHVRSGYLIVDELGQPLRPERYSDLWREMLADCDGVRDLDMRAARRASVTAMRDRGVPDHVVAAWHGHDEAVMRRNYSVAHKDGLRGASVSLSKVLGGNPL